MSTHGSLEEEERRLAALQVAAGRCSLEVGVWARTGRKGEDRAAVVPEFTGTTAEDYLAVFDGHRGSLVAQHAASTLHQDLRAKLDAPCSPTEACRSAFAACHASAQASGLQDGAAALCIFALRGGEVWVANAGDCRAVLCPRAGPPVRLSQDHRASDPAEESRVKAAGGVVEFGCLDGASARLKRATAAASRRVRKLAGKPVWKADLREHTTRRPPCQECWPSRVALATSTFARRASRRSRTLLDRSCWPRAIASSSPRTACGMRRDKCT